jgi:hypothetical protein
MTEAGVAEGGVPERGVTEPVGRLLDWRQEIGGRVRAAGFGFAPADLDGLRSGSMNVLLPLSVVHPADEAG